MSSKKESLRPRKGTAPLKTTRGRGRPRKSKIDDEAPKPKSTRGRGRPRKRPLDEEQEKQTQQPPSKKRKVQEVQEEPKEKKKPRKEIEEWRWEGWKEIYLVGTEWENYDDVFKVKWDFDHLYNALEEGGELYDLGKQHPVYLFGCTEPQLMKFSDGREQMCFLPVIIAVISSLAPPATLGLKSVQRVEEEIIPMQELKMDWNPYHPVSAWKVDPRRYKPLAFFLKCTQRKSMVRKMSEEQRRKYDYALPYIFLPRVLSDETPITEVTGVCTIGGKGISFSYDWEMDELEDFMKDLVEKEELKDAADIKTVRETVRSTVNAAKKKAREEKEERKKQIDALGEKRKKALEELKVYKYYPQNKDPDVEPLKAPFVNRYYGRASKII